MTEQVDEQDDPAMRAAVLIDREITGLVIAHRRVATIIREEYAPLVAEVERLRASLILACSTYGIHNEQDCPSPQFHDIACEDGRAGTNPPSYREQRDNLQQQLTAALADAAERESKLDHALKENARLLAQHAPQDVIAECIAMLDAAGFGKLGMGGNTLWAMVKQATERTASIIAENTRLENEFRYKASAVHLLEKKAEEDQSTIDTLRGANARLEGEADQLRRQVAERDAGWQREIAERELEIGRLIDDRAIESLATQIQRQLCGYEGEAGRIRERQILTILRAHAWPEEKQPPQLPKQEQSEREVIQRYWESPDASGSSGDESCGREGCGHQKRDHTKGECRYVLPRLCECQRFQTTYGMGTPEWRAVCARPPVAQPSEPEPEGFACGAVHPEKRYVCVLRRDGHGDHIANGISWRSSSPQATALPPLSQCVQMDCPDSSKVHGHYQGRTVELPQSALQLSPITAHPECPCCPDGCRDPHARNAHCSVHAICLREYRDRALKKIEEVRTNWAARLLLVRQRVVDLEERQSAIDKRIDAVATPRFVVTPEMREKVAISMYAIARGDTPFLVSETYWSRYSADALWKRRFYEATDCILTILGATVSAENGGRNAW